MANDMRRHRRSGRVKRAPILRSRFAASIHAKVVTGNEVRCASFPVFCLGERW